MTTKLITWDETLTTGIDWQDAQHQELLENLYDLYYALIAGTAKEQLPRSVQFLEQYAKTHLSMEADYMRKYNFPEKSEHLAQHTIFYERLDEMKSHLLKDTSFAAVATAATLCMGLNNWFITHIATYDQRLGKFLKQSQSQ